MNEKKDYKIESYVDSSDFERTEISTKIVNCTKEELPKVIAGFLPKEGVSRYVVWEQLIKGTIESGKITNND